MKRWAATTGWVSLLALGCLDTSAYGPEGFHCDTDADCEAPTYCFRQRCALASDVPVKPGPGNTGVPPDVTLTVSGGLDVQEDGTVIDGLDIQGCVQVRASNVTIRNSRIRCSSYYVILMDDDASNLLVEDVEIDGAGFGESIAFPVSHAVGRRLNIHHAGRGANLGTGTRLEGSYIHDLSGESVNAVVSYGGRGIVITGNTLVSHPGGPGTALNMDGALGALADVDIQRNWLSGGSPTAALGGGRDGTTGVALHHNRIERQEDAAPWNLRSGAVQYENVWDDTGEEIRD